MSEQQPMDLCSPTSVPPVPRIKIINLNDTPLSEVLSLFRLPGANKVNGYTYLVRWVLSKNNIFVESELKIIIRHIIDLGPEYIDVVRYLLVTFWAKLFCRLPLRIYQSLSEFAIENTEPKEHLAYTSAIIRQALATIYDKQGRYGDAISLLKKSLTNSSASSLSNDFKIETNLLIIALTYKTDSPLDNNSYLLTIENLLKASKSRMLKYMYYVYLAQSLDYRGIYSESARILIRLNDQRISYGEELMRKIRTLAVIGTLLLPISFCRLGFILSLCTDKTYYDILPEAILKKFCTLEIIGPEETMVIENILRPHHKAHKYNGVPILEYFTCEHNLYSMSRFNCSVKFEEFEHMLNIKSDVVEKVATRMIETKRLCANIGVDVINFTPPL